MATQNTFDFGDQQAATRSLKKISQLMQRAGQPVVSTSFDQKIKRTSGVSYREAMLTLASGQTVTMRVTQTGDVFQVLLNGQIKPIKNAGDQIRAVGEIAKLAEVNQAAFQKKQARVKTELPKSVKTAAPKMEVALQSRVSELDAQIAERQGQVTELKAELGEDATLDAVGQNSAFPMKWHDGETYDRDQFTLESTDEHGEMPPAWVLKADAVPVSTGTLDAATPELSAAAAETLAALAESVLDSVEDGDLPSEAGRDELFELGLVGRNSDGGNWLTQAGKDAAAGVATLDAARKHNQKDYVVYVVVGNKIESGWEYDDDAKEHKAENMPANLKSSAKVLKKAALKSKGIDPEDNASWLTGAQLDSADVSEAVDVAAQVLDGAVLDSVSTASAVATLRIALGVVENNYPINLAEGNGEQAQLEQENAESFRHAIALLDGADLPDEVKPSRAADEALDAAKELQDGLDSVDDDDESAEVSPDQESLFD